MKVPSAVSRLNIGGWIAIAFTAMLAITIQGDLDQRLLFQFPDSLGANSPRSLLVEKISVTVAIVTILLFPPNLDR
jgi:hypothetical protein